MKHELPQLPYAYDALGPYIDARTMELHHSKHHATYVAKLNEALEKHPDVAERPLDELLKGLDSVPDDIRTAVRNHGSGHWNHSFFWKVMKSPKEGGGGEPKGELVQVLAQTFGNFSSFRDLFGKTAASVFGSGWAWLVLDTSGKLAVNSTPNQDSPISRNEVPLLGLDMWEHAYYLKYQNRRLEYIEAWWNVINWEEVAENLKKAKK